MGNKRTVHAIECASPPHSEVVTAPPKSNEIGPPIGVQNQGYNQPMASSYPQSWNPVGTNIQQPNSFTPQYKPPINYVVRSEEDVTRPRKSCLKSCCIWCFSIIGIFSLGFIIRLILVSVAVGTRRNLNRESTNSSIF